MKRRIAKKILTGKRSYHPHQIAKADKIQRRERLKEIKKENNNG